MTEISVPEDTQGVVYVPFDGDRIMVGGMDRSNGGVVLPLDGVYSASSTLYYTFPMTHLIDELGRGEDVFLQLRLVGPGQNQLEGEVLATAPATITSGPTPIDGPYGELGTFVSGAYTGNVSCVSFHANQRDVLIVTTGRNDGNSGDLYVVGGDMSVHWVGPAEDIPGDGGGGGGG